MHANHIEGLNSKNLLYKSVSISLMFTAFARDCSELQALGFTTSGVYTVYVGDNQRPLAVYCDMTTESGGWTVILISLIVHHLFIDITQFLFSSFSLPGGWG